MLPTLYSAAILFTASCVVVTAADRTTDQRLAALEAKIDQILLRGKLERFKKKCM